MKILITGGAGYLGSVLTPFLLELGHQVRVVDSLMYGGEALLGNYQANGFEFLHGDIRNSEIRQQACRDVEAVVHLAAIVGDPACARQPELAKAINRDATGELFEASVKARVRRFVFSSTCSNYGRMDNSEALVNEESELRPVSLYAETKVDVEKMLLAHSDGFPAATILRFATLYGLSPRMRFDLTVNEFAMELFTRRHLVVFGEQFWRPYAHVIDVANVISQVLSAPLDKVQGQVFNIGDSKENYTKAQIVQTICSLLDFPVDIEKVDKKEDPRDYRVSFEKLRAFLALDMKRTIRHGAAEVIAAINQGVFSNTQDARYRN